MKRELCETTRQQLGGLLDRMFLYLVMCVGRMQVAIYRLVISPRCSLELELRRPVHARPDGHGSEESATVRDVFNDGAAAIAADYHAALQDTDTATEPAVPLVI